MRIGLIDVDSNNYPNLPLMKLSAYYKNRGDDVDWYYPFEERYDIVYISKVFSFSNDIEDSINADKVIRGGSGYCLSLVNGKEVFDKSKNICLPYEIEHAYPDYSLYAKYTADKAFGFLTRGCPRNCDFCIVAKKEGLKSVKVANIDEFWNGQKNIILNDPNILACKDWKNLLSQLKDTGAMIDFNQGLDIRLMTKEKIEFLNKLRISELHFAWDKYEDKDLILNNLKMFNEYRASKPNEHRDIVFTIVNFDTTFEQDLERIYALRKIGFWAYVMIYDKKHCDNKYIQLQGWVNNRVVFSVCDSFDKYLEYKKKKV